MSKSRTVLALVLSVAPAAGIGFFAGDAAAEQTQVKTVEIVVDGSYKPDRIEAREGERLRLKFVRKDYSGCTREVVFPSLNIRRTLPTNKAVLIELPALAPGEIEFRCGMNMVRGTIVVHPSSHSEQ
jgi:plastocyanin domain-containing protein